MTKLEAREEADYLKEILLIKLVYKELNPSTLLRVLRRLENLHYFIGRNDGEKYGRNLND